MSSFSGASLDNGITTPIIFFICLFSRSTYGVLHVALKMLRRRMKRSGSVMYPANAAARVPTVSLIAVASATVTHDGEPASDAPSKDATENT